jgi:hypothetical protein
MVSNLVFYQLVLIALVWVFLLLCWLEPSELAASTQRFGHGGAARRQGPSC